MKPHRREYFYDMSRRARDRFFRELVVKGASDHGIYSEFNALEPILLQHNLITHPGKCTKRVEITLLGLFCKFIYGKYHHPSSNY